MALLPEQHANRSRIGAGCFTDAGPSTARTQAMRAPSWTSALQTRTAPVPRSATPIRDSDDAPANTGAGPRRLPRASHGLLERGLHRELLRRDALGQDGRWFLQRELQGVETSDGTCFERQSLSGKSIGVCSQTERRPRPATERHAKRSSSARHGMISVQTSAGANVCRQLCDPSKTTSTCAGGAACTAIDQSAPHTGSCCARPPAEAPAATGRTLSGRSGLLLRFEPRCSRGPSCAVPPVGQATGWALEPTRTVQRPLRSPQLLLLQRGRRRLDPPTTVFLE